MKKVFEAPEMSISMFHSDDVVKTSGLSTYSEKVCDELESNGVNEENLIRRSYDTIF